MKILIKSIHIFLKLCNIKLNINKDFNKNKINN